MVMARDALCINCLKEFVGRELAVEMLCYVLTMTKRVSFKMRL